MAVGEVHPCSKGAPRAVAGYYHPSRSAVNLKGNFSLSLRLALSAIW